MVLAFKQFYWKMFRFNTYVQILGCWNMLNAANLKISFNLLLDKEQGKCICNSESSSIKMITHQDVFCRKEPDVFNHFEYKKTHSNTYLFVIVYFHTFSLLLV